LKALQLDTKANLEFLYLRERKQNWSREKVLKSENKDLRNLKDVIDNFFFQF
jgi:hypothetical protein